MTHASVQALVCGQKGMRYGHILNSSLGKRLNKKVRLGLIYHQKALDIRKRHLPSGHFRFGTSYNNMGEVYYGLGQYDIALEYYESACDVYKKSLTSRHIDIAILLINKIMIYEKKDDFQDVLSFYKKAYTCSEQHPDLIQIKHIIEHAENTKEMHLSIESFGTHWVNLLSPFKCIGSLDSRTAYRETHLSYRNIETQSLQKKEN
jgi:tetratricopeptide (TPR) repeat protein